MVMCKKQLMGLKVSSFMYPPWAVVLVVCVVGSLSTYATGAPILLQLDPTTLVGHRLVVSIEPVLLGGVTHMNIESNTPVVLLNSTVDATNASTVSFGSNSVDTPVTLDDLEMLSADVTTTEAGLPPMTTEAAIVDSQTAAAEVSSRLRFSPSRLFDEKDKDDVDNFLINFPHRRCPDGWKHENGRCRRPFNGFAKSDIFNDEEFHNNNVSDYPVQDFLMKPLGIKPRTRIRPDQDDVNNFLINFPHRCPEGWKLENGQCRRPFNGLNHIGRSRKKDVQKRKF